MLNILNELKAKFSTIYNLSLEVQAQYLVNCKIFVYNKGEVILKQGDICDSMMFVYKGFLRAYIVNAKGEKITTWFKSENCFVTSMNSYLKNKPSLLSIEAIEKTYLVSCKKSFVDKMIAKYPEVSLIYRNYLEQYFLEIENHLISLQSLDAKERYDLLFEEDQIPGIPLRAPLGHIASYLGITQPTLSRLRAKRD
jgi:CRP/FNR family transcriptional regulator, anaerobic regulatory protein